MRRALRLGSREGAAKRRWIATVASALAASWAASAQAAELPGIDALSTAPAAKQKRDAATQLAKSGVNPVRLYMDQKTGLPKLMAFAGGDLAKAAALTAPELVAKEHLRRLAPLFGADPAAAVAAKVKEVQRMPSGASITKLVSAVGGVEVFREETGVLLGAQGDLLAVNGFIAGGQPKVRHPLDTTPGLRAKRQLVINNGREAIGAALTDFGFDATAVAAALNGTRSDGGYDFYQLGGGVQGVQGSRLTDEARSKPVYFRLPNDLVPGYYVEVQVTEPETGGAEYYAYVVSAVDGKVLFRHFQTADADFAYRTWAETGGSQLPFPGPQGRNGTPHPTGRPDGYQAPFVVPNLVKLKHGPISTKDAWLTPGSTITKGNNVEAYSDGFAPDGLGPVDSAECNTNAGITGDFHACITEGGVFDRTYDVTKAPNVNKSQVMASITNLFYINNWLHDWYYDAGFNEASGNAQADNYGRGGAGNDSIKAEAQDYSGTNNANMSTPADGSRPRMQMYVFTGNGAATMAISAPAAIARSYTIGTAAFGAQSYDLSGTAVMAAPADGCVALTNAAAVAGKIAIIDRGTCGFNIKAANAQAAGAVGVVIANNAAGVINMSGTGAITIPTISVSQADGNAIKANLPATLRMTRATSVSRDGTLDNAIIAHEWGHYISNRLVGNAAGLNTNHSRGLGEGWADFHALLMMVKPEDLAVAGNENFNGVYGMAGYTSGGPNVGSVLNNGYYYGIRRYPYSTDLTKNPLTFRHIQNGVALPADPAPNFGADGSNNAAVHSTGEVWSSMLWECYAGLLRDTRRLSFHEAQERMKRYLVAGYKLTPVSPTLLEARDALLAAIGASDAEDQAICLAGFAKRGAGLRAVAPDRYSTTNGGVAESFEVGKDVEFVGATLDDSVKSCDRDGVLDNNERGILTLSVKNTGSGMLTDLKVTATPVAGGFGFPDGPTVKFAPIAPGAVGTARLEVTYTAGVVTYGQLDLRMSAPGLRFGDQRASFSLLTNADAVQDSTTDDTEAAPSAWTAGGTAGLLTWVRSRIAADDHRYYGYDNGSAGAVWMQTPPMTVDAAANLVISFKHRHNFEADAGGAYDGGVLEISADNGQTWTDVGASAAPGYNGTMVAYAGNLNPLKGRQGYVRINPSFPDQDTVTVNLGTTYANKTVLFRFRIGTDNSGSGGGWEIDDISVAGITSTPFRRLVAHRNLCIGTGFEFLSGTQTAWINQAFANRFTFKLLADNGQPVPAGTPVTFSAPEEGPSGTFNGSTQATVAANAQGIAVAPEFVANGIAGTYKLTISSPAAVTDATLALENRQTTTTAITKVSPNPALTGEPVNVEVAVSGVKAGANATVWSTDASCTAIVDDKGVGNCSLLFGTPGKRMISASFAGQLGAAPSASAETGVEINARVPAALSLISGDGQWTVPGRMFGEPLVVKVVDEKGMPAAGAVVKFAGPSSGAGINFVLAGPVAYLTTGADGHAVARNFYSNGIVGTFAVSASLEGEKGSASFQLANRPAIMPAVDFSGTGRGQVMARDAQGRWIVHTNAGALPLNPQPDESLELLAIGDFDGDLKSDLVFRQPNGDVMLWRMDGLNRRDVTFLANAPAVWKVKGVGDFDGDGKADLLWRGDDGTVGVWLMNGTTIKLSQPIERVESHWTLLGAADVDGDRKADFIWVDNAGRVGFWLMNGAVRRTAFLAGATVPAGAIYAGHGDFNSDATADLVWVSAERQVQAWVLRNGQVVKTQDFGQLAEGSRIDSTQDIDGDTLPDLIIQRADGAKEIWFTDGQAVRARAVVK